MIISTPRANRSSLAGFTLSEVIIASSLSGMLLAGVLSAFLMIGRTGFNAANYSEMEAQLRRGIEVFARDARVASNIRWNSSLSVTFSVPSATSVNTQVTYAFVPTDAGGTFQCWAGGAASEATRRVLVRNVDPTFEFRRYKLARSDATPNAATNDLETKQIEVAMRTSIAGANAPGASQATVSGRFVLRNKKVSN